MASQVTSYPGLIIIKQRKVLLLLSKDRIKYDGNIWKCDTNQTQKHDEVV